MKFRLRIGDESKIISVTDAVINGEINDKDKNLVLDILERLAEIPIEMNMEPIYNTFVDVASQLGYNVDEFIEGDIVEVQL